MESGRYTVKCKVLEVQKSTYTDIVICDATNSHNILTVFPNWEGYIPEKGDIGYCEFEVVKSGDRYWDKYYGYKCYGYNMTIFKKFVLQTDTTPEGEIIL